MQAFAVADRTSFCPAVRSRFDEQLALLQCPERHVRDEAGPRVALNFGSLGMLGYFDDAIAERLGSRSLDRDVETGGETRFGNGVSLDDFNPWIGSGAPRHCPEV